MPKNKLINLRSLSLNVALTHQGHQAAFRRSLPELQSMLQKTPRLASLVIRHHNNNNNNNNVACGKTPSEYSQRFELHRRSSGSMYALLRERPSLFEFQVIDFEVGPKTTRRIFPEGPSWWWCDSVWGEEDAVRWDLTRSLGTRGCTAS